MARPEATCRSPYLLRHDYDPWLKAEPRIALAIWALLPPGVALGHELLRGSWPPAEGLALLALLSAPMLALGVWGHRNRTRRLRPVTATDEGLRFEPGLGRRSELVRWEEIDRIRAFDGHDLEARYVNRTPGLRIESGTRVFWIYRTISDFERLLVTIEGHRGAGAAL